jgi:hypothetical protein
MNKSHYIYINSKNRNSNEKIYNFNVYLKNPIVVNKNQGINCSVIGFSMLNIDYNLKGIYFKVDEVNLNDNSINQYTYNIPDGNYSYISLMEYLNVILTGKIKVEYLKHRNAYKFTNLNSNNYDYYIIPENANKYLGIYEEMDLSSYTSITKEGSYINLTNYSHIIIKSNLLDFEDNTQDNIDMNGLRSSSILFMIDKQDIPPFSLISYRNFDKSDNYSYNITNKQINIIDLHLYNEKGELLTQTDDYFLILKITIFNKDNNNVSIPYLDDIRFLIMSMMFDKKKSYNRIE